MFWVMVALESRRYPSTLRRQWASGNQSWTLLVLIWKEVAPCSNLTSSTPTIAFLINLQNISKDQRYFQSLGLRIRRLTRTRKKFVYRLFLPVDTTVVALLCNIAAIHREKCWTCDRLIHLVVRVAIWEHPSPPPQLIESVPFPKQSLSTIT